tara:strand:+ start:3645 stop:4028 length:384 start_codon:yes stop_codon:yes gene_type:complete
MLSNSNSHRRKVETKKVMKLKQKALEWEEWHGTWLEATLNEFFDTCSVQVIKSEILHHILEDEWDHEELPYAIFEYRVKDFLKNKAKTGMYENPETIPTPATIDTMFQLEIPIIEEMYETFCEHYGI